MLKKFYFKNINGNHDFNQIPALNVSIMYLVRMLVCVQSFIDCGIVFSCRM